MASTPVKFSTSTGFLQMMISFFDELNTVLPPDSKGAKWARENRQLVEAALGSGQELFMKLPRTEFMKSIGPYAQTLFSVEPYNRVWIEANLEKIEFLKKMDAASMWPRMTENTRIAFVGQLRMLYQMGQALEMVPPGLVSSIEKLMQKEIDRAEREEATTGNAPDMNALVGNMLGGLGITREQADTMMSQLPANIGNLNNLLPGLSPASSNGGVAAKK